MTKKCLSRGPLRLAVPRTGTKHFKQRSNQDSVGYSSLSDFPGFQKRVQIKNKKKTLVFVLRGDGDATHFLHNNVWLSTFH